MSTLIAKPGEWFLVPDPTFRGAASLVSATSQAGPSLGPAVPRSSNQGAAIPVLSGVPDADVEGLALAVARPGGLGAGEWGWRRASDATTEWRGQDEPRHVWGHHAPFADSTGSTNVFSVWCGSLGYLITGRIDPSTSLVTVRRLRPGVDRYDEWTTQPTWTLDNAIASGDHNAAAIELPDGSVLLVVRIDDTPQDFDVYRSTDGGETFRLVLADLVSTFREAGASTPTHSSDSQIKLTRAGEWIRLTWISGGTVISFGSTDRGLTWKRLTNAGITVYSTGATDDPYVYDVVGLDDAGTFMLSHGSSAPALGHLVANGFGDWEARTFGGVALPATARAVALVRTPVYFVEVVFYASGVAGAYMMRRAKVSGGTSQFYDQGWEQADEIADFEAGIKYAPGRWSAVWAGDRIFLHGSRRNVSSSYTDVGYSLGFYLGGWTRRPLWRYRYVVALDNMTEPLLSRVWTPEVGTPTEPTGSPWTETGTGTGAANMDRLRIESSSGAAKRYVRSISPASGPSWGQDQNATFRGVLKLDSGDGSDADDYIAVRVISQNNADDTQLDVSLRFSPTGIRVYDNNAAASLADLAITMDHASRFVEWRLALRKVGAAYKARLAALDTSTGVWVQTSLLTLDDQAIVGGACELRFGHLVAPASGTYGSEWRELAVIEGDNAHQYDFDNPADVIGYPMVPAPVRIERGVDARWSGLGGAQSDGFDAEVVYRNGVAALQIESPRYAWNSTDDANQELVFDADPENGVGRWIHDAIAIFGCNNAEVIVDYDDDPAFGSPSGGATIDLRRFGTGTTPATVLVANGTAVRLVGADSNQWVAGELVGAYMRATSGSAAGKTWKITRHPSELVIHCDEETSTLVSQGLGVADEVEFFGPHGAATFATVNKRYMRIRLSDADVAEGIHRLGTVIVGMRETIDVPFDWSRTVSEQPNTTTYRTRGAVSWAYQEGPSQRTWTGRIVGDVKPRQRDRFAALLRQVGFDARAVAWIFDDERPEEVALVRVTSGAGLDQSIRFRDENDVIRAGGDLSVTLVEEP